MGEVRNVRQRFREGDIFGSLSAHPFVQVQNILGNEYAEDATHANNSVQPCCAAEAINLEEDDVCVGLGEAEE